MYKRDFKAGPSFEPLLTRQPAELDEEEKKKAGQAASVQRSAAGATGSLLHLQQNFGNRYVQRALSLARQSGESETGQEIENAIQQKRGGGQPLDSGVRREMESSFQADFSNVRVHHDAGADTLNRAVNARAFTTGPDIFFRQGAYNPGTSGGKELLAHELTHVVQQNGDGIHRKLTVSEPGDVLEREADQVAKSVIQTEQQPTEGKHPGLQRQPEALPEDEEEKKKKKEGV